MEYRNLKKQYSELKYQIDISINTVLTKSNFISGIEVSELEKLLSDYVGVKHCISCANGTDALSLAMMALDISCGDAVFVPDFTFFSTAEVVSLAGATPIFVDVRRDTCNMDPVSLKAAIESVLSEGGLKPRAIIAVDLFGQPAEFSEIRKIAKKYNIVIIEDGAQGFGGNINGKRACSFGDISTTSFFPAKPLGCYGDGGAIFTDNDEYAELISSLHVHGKGTNKYDNIRIGLNSRLDTIQAAILKVKLEAFNKFELGAVNQAAGQYNELLGDIDEISLPVVIDGYYSSWAQYTILLPDASVRSQLQAYLKEHDIPSMVYYPKPLHTQTAFSLLDSPVVDLNNSIDLSERVLSLPMGPYIERAEQEMVAYKINQFFKRD